MDFIIPHFLCFWLLFLFQSLFSEAQTYSNISSGSSLTALDNDASWSSPSGDFAFGFRPMGADSFLLGIWFNKIPDKTIIWSANQGQTVRSGSKVELTNAGLLVLNDPGGNELWKAELTDSSVSAYAAMLNTGNFVLVNQNSINIWESFTHPTDTILPTQILNRGGILASRLRRDNYTSGRFQLRLQPDGKLLLYTMAYPTPDVNTQYWEPNETQPGSQFVFDQRGNIFLTQTNGSLLLNLSSANTVPTSRFYHRAILDYDGVFRHYVYPRGSQASNIGWSDSWSTMWYVPPNICLTSGGLTGSGACGYNSYCRLDDDQRPECVCPPGFSPLDPNDILLKGCKQDFVTQICGKQSEAGSLFDFREVPNTDWPLTDFGFFPNHTEDWCRKSCLDDCLCSVAIFRDGSCWFKRIPLSNGMMDATVGGKSLIKVRRNNDSFDFPGSCLDKKEDRSHLIFIIVSVLLGGSCCLNLAISLFAFVAYRKRPKETVRDKTMPGMNLRNFTYKELENATDGFRVELGHGAFSVVYKGVLGSDGRNLVAVKKLVQVKENEVEFMAEVNAIGRTNHKNLVQLLGFCNESSHRLLVYEFMRNGSLAGFLFTSPRPGWFQRMQIAFGIARGLMYLHEECKTQIIHCDIKPQNILLDDSFTARISDFGLAKLLKTDQSRTSTGIRGTKGYVAPEWFKNMAITIKVDVYSFGIMLLEIICCRRNVESNVEDEYKMILTDWAYDCYKEKRLDLLLEEDDEARDDIKKVEKLVMIAIWCIQEDPSLRPTMRKVTQMMEGAVHVSAPPDPSSSI